MKKIIFFCIAISFIACNDEVNDEPTNTSVIAETPPKGMKLKQKEGENIEHYFYHSNGFIDSIAAENRDRISKKFIYNELNQISVMRYWYKHATNPQYNRNDITYYIYNSSNQIISSKTYGKNDAMISFATYTYNSDGSLYNPVKIVENEI